MNKTKIEWCDYTINPVKGLCPMACSYCYARAMYKRFKWNPIIRYDDWVWHEGGYIPKGSKVFVGSTIELFGDWVKPEWLEIIFSYCKSCPSHTFIFLTKQPQNLIKLSPFPDNCWVGVTATDSLALSKAIYWLSKVEAKVKYISAEPLLNGYPIDGLSTALFKTGGINWIIIGQQTPISKKTTPKIEWIKEIVEAADKAGIPVFLKNNLRNFIYGEYGGKYKQIFKYAQDGGRELRQEMPK